MYVKGGRWPEGWREAGVQREGDVVAAVGSWLEENRRGRRVVKEEERRKFEVHGSRARRFAVEEVDIAADRS